MPARNAGVTDLYRGMEQGLEDEAGAGALTIADCLAPQLDEVRAAAKRAGMPYSVLHRFDDLLAVLPSVASTIARTPAPGTTNTKEYSHA